MAQMAVGVHLKMVLPFSGSDKVGAKVMLSFNSFIFFVKWKRLKQCL